MQRQAETEVKFDVLIIQEGKESHAIEVDLETLRELSYCDEILVTPEGYPNAIMRHAFGLGAFDKMLSILRAEGIALEH